MFGLLKIIGLGLVLIIGYPLLNEETVSVCHSVEKRFVVEAARQGRQMDAGQIFAMGIMGEISQGAFASRVVKAIYPDLPPFAGCVVVYYKMISDPDFKRTLITNFNRGT